MVVLTDGPAELTDAERETLWRAGIPVDERPVERPRAREEWSAAAA
ncbi:hypothetical protein AB0L40_03535 [Patulibacter sp. NPDC049589]